MTVLFDETLRDGPQSLWATRMSTESMLGIARWLARAKFGRVCITAAAAFETAIRFQREDPWERIRLLRRAMPNNCLDVLIRGRNLFGWRRYPDDVVELFFKCLRRNGVDHVKIFDGLNDVKNMERMFSLAKSAGLGATGIVMYSISPVHGHEYFAGTAKRMALAGVDSLCLYDASGILEPSHVGSLIQAFRAAGDKGLPVELHCHTTMGLAYAAYAEGMKAGVDALVTACRPLADGQSVPSALCVLDQAEAMKVNTGVQIDALRLADDYAYWAAYQEKHKPADAIKYNDRTYRKFITHQIPGGMMANFESQLKDLGMLHRLDEVLEEVPCVRADLGYPIMVTPFSQFIGVVATLNVLTGQRYKHVPRELYEYAQGKYGKPPARINPDVLDRLLGGSDKGMHDEERSSEPLVHQFRREQGPFRSDEELLLNLFYGPKQIEAFRRAEKPIRPPTLLQPMLSLVHQLATQKHWQGISVRSRQCQFEIEIS